MDGHTKGRHIGTQEHRQQERQTEKGPHTIDQTRQEHPDQPMDKNSGNQPCPTTQLI